MARCYCPALLFLFVLLALCFLTLWLTKNPTKAKRDIFTVLLCVWKATAREEAWSTAGGYTMMPVCNIHTHRCSDDDVRPTNQAHGSLCIFTCGKALVISYWTFSHTHANAHAVFYIDCTNRPKEMTWSECTLGGVSSIVKVVLSWCHILLQFILLQCMFTKC